MITRLVTEKQIAGTHHKIGTELWHCSVTGEPVITRVNVAEQRRESTLDIERGLGGDPSTPTRLIFVGKGAHRAARRALSLADKP